MSLARLVDVRALRQQRPRPDGTLVAATAAPATSRLGTVVAISGLGLAVQAVGDALARAGHGGVGLDLFFVGVVTIFASCAWRLAGAGATRDERLAAAVVLGLGLVLSSWLASPLLFDGYDALLHETTLWQILDGRRLFASNTTLPVSPWYPGLELLTAAVRWCTGLPVVAAELVVVGLSRFVLVVVLYLFCERVTGSARAAGIAVLVYALSPQFYSFNSAYSYQTLALAFGVAAVYFALVAGDEAGRGRRRRYITLSLVAVAGATVTHHLTGWLTVGLLVVWAAAATLDARHEPAAALRGSSLRLVAAGSLLISAAWTAVTAPKVFPYLAPVFSSAWSSIVGLLLHAGHHRELFRSASGVATPTWQQALIVFSVLVSVALVAAVCLQFLARRRQRERRLQRLVAVLVSIGYVAVLASPLEGASSQVGQRGSTFVYFGIALLSAAWLVGYLRRVPAAALVVVASAAFLGGLIFGSGASWSYVPGPYVPVSDTRSVDGPSIAAARWVAGHLPVGAHLAADRDNSVLMAAVGHLSPVTEAAGQLNVGLLYFDPRFGGFERAMIRKYDIRYLVVDRRLLSGPPYFGVYFEPGVPAPGTRNRLTKQDLGKFASVPGLRSIYSNGPITIYDAAGILGTPATGQPPIGRPQSRANLEVLVPAALVGAAWLAVLRRRRRRRRAATGAGTAVLVGAMAGAIAVMFAYVPSGLPPDPLAWTVLAVLAVLAARAWRAEGRAPATGTEGVAARDGAWPETGHRRRAGGRVLVAAGALAYAAAIGVGVVSDLHAWRVESAVSVSPGARPTSAEVSLAGGARHGARLEVVRSGHVVSTIRLAPDAHQQVALPAKARAAADRLVLVANGRHVASVDG